MTLLTLLRNKLCPSLLEQPVWLTIHADHDINLGELEVNDYFI